MDAEEPSRARLDAPHDTREPIKAAGRPGACIRCAWRPAVSVQLVDEALGTAGHAEPRIAGKGALERRQRARVQNHVGVGNHDQIAGILELGQPARDGPGLPRSHVVGDDRGLDVRVPRQLGAGAASITACSGVTKRGDGA